MDSSCLHNGAQKVCGSDGCGDVCGQCSVANTKCQEPEGICIEVPKYDVMCDESMPHGAGICLIGSFVESGIALGPEGGSETRPVNAYVNFIIKHRSCARPRIPNAMCGARAANP